MRLKFKLLSALLAAASFSALAADDYRPGPDSAPHEGVPKGEVRTNVFDTSAIFPGTTRAYWIYVPQQYDPSHPACLYVCQDGVLYNAPVVFDNLIARHEMPVTIGVFVMHGKVKAESNKALDRYNRSYEYDGLGDNYARFLLEELLPEVEKQKTADGRPIHLSTNANDRAIAGASSGAIAAFTAAWERPDAFHRVFSAIGTYVDQRGGNVYPALIRKTEAKPLRVFLQDGTNDLNIVGGNWHLANEEMLSAFEFAGYEVNHIWGEGGHNGKQATAIFPDAMRWLWRDWPQPVEAGKDSRQPVARALIPGEGWQIAGNSTPAEFEAAQAGSPDALEKIKNRICAHQLSPSAWCVNQQGRIYAADLMEKRLWMIDTDEKATIVDTGKVFAGGLCLSPDQSLLLASDPHSQFVYSYHIKPDGTLADGQPYYYLEVPNATFQSGAGGMAVDTNGTLYVATLLGVQMCDQAGRVQGIISAPRGVILSNLCMSGPNFDEILASDGRQIYRRKINAIGAPSFRAPIKPAPPHL